MSVEITILAYCNNPEGMTNCSGPNDPSCPLNRLGNTAKGFSADTPDEFWNTQRRFFAGDILIEAKGKSHLVSCQRYHEAERVLYGLAVLSVVK